MCLKEISICSHSILASIDCRDINSKDSFNDFLDCVVKLINSKGEYDNKWTDCLKITNRCRLILKIGKDDRDISWTKLMNDYTTVSLDDNVFNTLDRNYECVYIILT